jgi:hypothetical protein
MDPHESVSLSPDQIEALRAAIRQTIAYGDKVRLETRQTREQCRRVREELRAGWEKVIRANPDIDPGST